MQRACAEDTVRSMTTIAKKKPAPKKPAPKATTKTKKAGPPTARAANEFLSKYRMKLLWPSKGPRKQKSHPGLYLAGVTAKMANDILAGELVFMPAPMMTVSERAQIERRQQLSMRRWAGSAHHKSSSLDD